MPKKQESKEEAAEGGTELVTTGNAVPEDETDDDYNNNNNNNKKNNKNNDEKKNEENTEKEKCKCCTVATEYNASYFNERSNRFKFLGIIMLIIYGNYFLAILQTDFKAVELTGKSAVKVPTTRLISSLFLLLGCLGIFHLIYKQKNALNNNNKNDIGLNTRTIVGILFIIGGIAQLFSVIQFEQWWLGNVAGGTFLCKDFVEQEIPYENQGTKFKKAGVNLCLLPQGCEIIMWLTPIIVGLDLLFGKLFNTNTETVKCIKYIRLTAYTLIILIQSILLTIFYGSLFTWCNVFHNYVVEKYGNNVDSDLTKCNEEGYFPGGLNTNGAAWGGITVTGVNTPVVNYGNGPPGFALDNFDNLKTMFSGYVMLLVGSAFTLLVAIIGGVKASCGKTLGCDSLQCICNGKRNVPCLSGFSGFIILLGALFVLFTGLIVGHNGYLDPLIGGQTTASTNFPVPFFEASIARLFVVYGYYFYICCVAFLVIADLYAVDA